MNGLDEQRAREHEKGLRQKLQDDTVRIQELLGPKFIVTLASPRAGSCVLVMLKGKTGQGNDFVAKLCPDWDKEKFLVSWNGNPRDEVEAEVNAAIAKVKP
jgi:hypothetical protein